VETAGPDVQVYFASDHGFTATTEVLRINTWLGEKGYLTWAKSDDSPQAMRREASDFANLDWDKTVAYCRTPSSNGIHIRVARNPGEAGIAPEEYERFRDKLIEDLKSIRNDDGEQVVTDVLKREEWFPGAHMDKAADLTLVLRDHGFEPLKRLRAVTAQFDLHENRHMRRKVAQRHVGTIP